MVAWAPARLPRAPWAGALFAGDGESPEALPPPCGAEALRHPSEGGGVHAPRVVSTDPAGGGPVTAQGMAVLAPTPPALHPQAQDMVTSLQPGQWDIQTLLIFFGC